MANFALAPAAVEVSPDFTATKLRIWLMIVLSAGVLPGAPSASLILAIAAL